MKEHWSQDGVIHAHLKGQTIIGALTDGTDLILIIGNGEEIRIGFDEHRGPIFKGRNVRVVVPTIGSMLFAGG
jgi:hypothetical protein